MYTNNDQHTCNRTNCTPVSIIPDVELGILRSFLYNNIHSVTRKNVKSHTPPLVGISCTMYTIELYNICIQYLFFFFFYWSFIYQFLRFSFLVIVHHSFSVLFYNFCSVFVLSLTLQVSAVGTSQYSF